MEKVIPKYFNGISDLEAMMLSSVLGVMISLREDLISLQQAESYWLNEAVINILKEISVSDEMIDIFTRGIKLKEIQYQSDEYYQLLDELIDAVKEKIANCYTEYDELPGAVLN